MSNRWLIKWSMRIVCMHEFLHHSNVKNTVSSVCAFADGVKMSFDAVRAAESTFSHHHRTIGWYRNAIFFIGMMQKFKSIHVCKRFSYGFWNKELPRKKFDFLKKKKRFFHIFFIFILFYSHSSVSVPLELNRCAVVFKIHTVILLCIVVSVCVRVWMCDISSNGQNW